MGFKCGDDNYSRINGPWNQGRELNTLSIKHRKKISDSLVGRNKGEHNPMFNKEPWNKGKPMLDNVKIALLEANIGSRHSPEHIKKIRDSHLGKKYGNGFINIGKNEKEILEQLEIDCDTKIERQYPICGFFVDGYSKCLNIIFEVDERGHKYSKEKDKHREDIIVSELNCEIIRILDY